MAAPNGKIAPNLRRLGIRLQRYVNADSAYSYFNMGDPVVGGYTPDRVALRRAVALAYDIETEIRIIRRGNAIAAQGPVAPRTYGYDPSFRSDNSSHDPARANALLDLFGYLDRDGDGWRERPDGSPLVLRMASLTAQVDRQYNENWARSMRGIHVQMRFESAQFPEQLKAARAGTLQMWFLGGTALDPDGQAAFARYFSESMGEQNFARFQLTTFDDIYRRMLNLPDGPERLALFKQASEIAVAYMPYRTHVHRIYNDFSWPWVAGYRQPFFREQIWQYVEVDGERRARALA
jgi:ABC-type transport system substrate-binding protein